MSNGNKIAARIKPHALPQIEHITPSTAKEWLGTMIANRKRTDNKVIEFAVDMEQGRWVLNGETIKFSDKGNLIDGQHRLEACILAKKSFRSYVVRDVDDPRAFSTIDVGKSRSHGDIFSIVGIADAANAAAAAMALYHWKKGHLKNLPGPSGVDKTKIRRMVAGTVYTKAASANRVSKEELLEFVQPHRHKIAEAIKTVVNMKIQKAMTVSTATALLVLFEEKDKAAAFQFMRDLASGENLKQGDPVYTLREKLVELRHGAAKVSRWHYMLLAIKAWNFRRAGQRVRYFRMLEDEKFPDIE